MSSVEKEADQTAADEKHEHAMSSIELAEKTPTVIPVAEEAPTPDQTAADEKHEHGQELKKNCAYQFAFLLAYYPCVVLIFLSVVILIASVIGMDGFEVTISTGGARSAYADPNDIRTKRSDAWSLTQAENLVVKEQQPYRETASGNSFLNLVYTLEFTRKGGDTVFTEDFLTQMKELEDAIFNDPDYQKLCWLCGSDWTTITGCTNSTDCRIPRSPLNFFFPSFNETGAAVYDGRGDFTSDLEATLLFLDSPAMRDVFNSDGSSYHLTDVFGPNNSFVSSSTRSLFFYGIPLPGYVSAGDDPDGQAATNDNNTIHLVETYIQPWERDHSLPVFVSGGAGYFAWFIEGDLLADAQLAMLSVCAVTIILCYHLRSGFLAAIGMTQIIFCFPVAIFLTFDVLDIRYFDTLNTFLLFVILGIGADDIFVFYDAWRQSAHLTFHVAETVDPNYKCCTFSAALADNPTEAARTRAQRNQRIRERMAYTFERASAAMLVTSITTFFAFLVGVFSVIPPTQAFGTFAALLIVINYSLVISLFPAAVVIHERYFVNQPFLLACFVPWCQRTCSSSSTSVDAAAEPSVAAANNSGTPDKDKTLTWEEWFVDKYFPMLQGYSHYFLFIAGTWFIASVSSAVQLEADTQAPEFFGPDHPYTQWADASATFIKNTEDPVVELQVAWGMLPYVNNKGFSPFDFGSSACGGGVCGIAIPDPDFVFATEEDQLFIEEVCDVMVQNPFSRDQPNTPHSCFVHDLRSYRESLGQEFPVPEADLPDVLSEFFTLNDHYLFEKRIQFNNETQSITYMSVGFLVDFLAQEFYPWQGPVDRCYTWFKDAETDLIAEAPEGLQGGFLVENVMAPLFVNSRVGYLFTTSALNSVIYAGIAAFFVLLFATKNIQLAAIAFASIVYVVVSVMGVMKMLGWKVGLIEAMCMSLIVGFSVDYVVHLAHAYMAKVQGHDGLVKAKDNLDALKHALGSMGVSVVFGFITTFSASIFLLFTVLTFFSRFGIYICMTIIFSVLTALFLFSSLLLYPTLAPVGNAGNIWTLFGKKAE